MTDKLLKRHPEAESHPSGERVVVFHKSTKNSIVLNPTGSWLWEQLEQPRSRQETRIQRRMRQECRIKFWRRQEARIQRRRRQKARVAPGRWKLALEAP